MTICSFVWILWSAFVACVAILRAMSLGVVLHLVSIMGVITSSFAVATLIVLYWYMHSWCVAELIVLVKLNMPLLLIWLLLTLASLTSLATLVTLSLNLLWLRGTRSILLAITIIRTLEEFIVIYFIQFYFGQVLLEVPSLHRRRTSWLVLLVSILNGSTSSSVMELLVVLVCHLHLELILKRLRGVLLIRCVSVIVLEMSLDLAVWRGGLQTVNVFLVREGDAVLADNWSAITLLLLVVCLVLVMLLFLKHIIYLTHIVLVYLPVISIAWWHRFFVFIQFNSIYVELLGIWLNFLPGVVLVSDCVRAFHLLVLHCSGWDQAALTIWAVGHGII